VRSSWSSSRSAAGERSIFHAIPFHDFLKRNSFAAAFFEGTQALFSDLQILEVFEVFEDGFAGVKGLGSSGALREAVQALFDVGRKVNREHGKSPLYKYSADRCLLKSGADGDIFKEAG
jgi:hypothetical protein